MSDSEDYADLRKFKETRTEFINFLEAHSNCTR